MSVDPALVAKLSTKPGVYLFRDARGAVLYVGKAKSLRARVRSYFQSGTELAFGRPRRFQLTSRPLASNPLSVDCHGSQRLREDRWYLAPRRRISQVK